MPNWPPREGSCIHDTYHRRDPGGLDPQSWQARWCDLLGHTDDEQRYVVVCNRQQVPDGSLVDKGQRWRVTGTSVAREVTINGYVLQEQQIEATEAELLRKR